MEIVKQDGIMDCGISCLLSIIRYYGGNVPIEYLREKTNTTKNGVSAYKIVETAKSLGFDSYGLNGKLEDLKEEYLPIIAHVIINKNLKHFIVIYQINKIKQELIVMDPGKGKKTISFKEFNLITSYNYIYLKKKQDLPNIIVKKSVKQWINIFSKEHKSYLLYIIIMSIIVFVLNIIVGFHLTFILSIGINVSIKSNVIKLTGILLIIYFLKNILSFIRDKTTLLFNILFDEYITKKYYQKLILLPYTYYKNRTTGEIISRMEDLNTIKEFLTNFSTIFTTDVIVVLVFIIILFNKNKSILLLLLILSFVLFIIQLFSSRILKNRLENQKEKIDYVNTIFVDTLEKTTTIKNLHLEKNYTSKFFKSYENLLNSSYKVSKVNLVTNFLKNLFHDLFYIIFFLLLGIRVINKKISLGMIIILDNIIKYYLESYSRCLILFNDTYKFKISKNRIENLFMIKEENFEGKNYCINKELNGLIIFNHLDYSFSSKKIFNNLNLKINPNDKVFFYGKSGTGKSTLMKMLMRYIEIPFGNITINGIDINHYHLDVIRNKISYVSQTDTIFKDTIKNNITLNRNISYEKLDKICEITNVKEIIEKYDTKLNTLVDDVGIGLSGGERQRIILARTLLGNSDIYIFDEALNQIDARGEREILKNIFNYLSNKIVIVISHRMTNRDLYNKIIKLNKGKIYEEV